MITADPPVSPDLMVILAAVTPIDALGIADLARRYGVRKPSLTEWLARAKDESTSDPDLPKPPAWGKVNDSTDVVDRAEWDAYEAARRAAGLPLPGERRRGPRAKPDSQDEQGVSG